ncbi:3-hydroxyacyl-CoA dehydrogenase family protein [Salsuginibacillus kocurii]|uniref:3-hydroxyacyl-CoA dehydrogenase family protein n=1 Tax=Salsuginibacillus kocurii TaxID=427078 RepID=UPI00037DA87C|nr:3-hydroxyacyl-CoA dehydrogenase family protein [Salsuginibacillus kocurii]
MGQSQMNQISVIGAGAMGSQIALVCAFSGFQVILQDIEESSLKRAEESLNYQMDRRIKKGKLTEEAVQTAFNRLTYTTSLEEAVESTDFVIEAIVEKVETKQQLFKKLDQLAPPHTILASNSSSIPSSYMAPATNRPKKVCNMHFFNPALVMELVEVVQGEHTSAETAELTVELTKQLNKTPILLKKEINGFVANRLLGKLMNEAIDLLENDIATAEEIDLAATKALNHPIGPFALIDLTGLDVHYHVRMERYYESGDEADKPAAIIKEKVERGELGKKAGKGFYTYSS